jgi:predicted phage terminase large subunit-like protein
MTSAAIATPSLPRLSPEQLAAAEILRRRKIRSECIEWCRLSLGFEPAAHHRLIVREMDDLMASTSYDTLLLFAPPGSAKSSYVSVAYPPHWMARNPGRSVIAASHSAELAAKWGRRVRNLIAAHSAVLGVALATDSQAADRWALQDGGEYLAAGVQAGIAGFRADLGIIDDPFGSKEDAYSERIRERVWDWYINDFSARLKPNAKRVIMHTRWHLDDLAGRIIEQAAATGQQIRIVKLPAIAESGDPLGRKPGEYLWDEPSGYDYAAFLKRRKMETAALEWAALYQQEPVPESGGFFQREWFKYYDQIPANVRSYGASDYAVTADDGDFTVHGVASIDGEGNIYLRDWWRAQTTTDVWVDVLLDMGSRHSVFDWAEEKGQIEKSVGPFIAKRMAERNINFHRQQFTSATDKATRAQSFRGRLSQGRVFFPRHAAWRPALEAELLSFPAGKHDDQVDALSLFGRMVDKMFPPRDGKKLQTKPASTGSWMAV